uniref:Heme-binding protein 1 n=2 Tax=Phasianus colchicus TaxID=9054 RepID=A0A669PPQ3_PHACC
MLSITHFCQCVPFLTFPFPSFLPSPRRTPVPARRSAPLGLPHLPTSGSPPWPAGAPWRSCCALRAAERPRTLPLRPGCDGPSRAGPDGNMLGMIKNSLLSTVETWPYRVLSKGEKEQLSYEERECEGGQFAVVEVTGKPFDEASKEAALKLLKYVGGSNDKGAGMGMTAPVSITAFPAEDGSLQQKVKVYLRIPNQFQASPPCPSDESIKIEERQGMTIYSMQFGGYAKEVDYVNYAAKLKTALGSEAAYRKDFYFCNGYDPPMKPYGRRNEVWFVKE